MEETTVFGTPLDLNLDLTTPLTPQKPDTRALQVQRDLLEGEIAALQNQKNMLDSSLDQRIGLGKFLLPENLYTTNNPLNPSQAVTTSDLNSLIEKKNEELQNVVNQITKINANFFQVTAPPVKDFTTEIASLQEETKPQVEPEPTPEPEPEPEPEAKKQETPPPPPPPYNREGNPPKEKAKNAVAAAAAAAGLAVGAARAAEERAVVEKQREVAFQELLKEQVKAGAKSPIDPKFQREIDQDYIKLTKEVNENKGSLDLLNLIDTTLKTNDATGLTSFAKQLGYKIRSAFDTDTPMDAKTAVEKLLNELIIGDAEEILGQSSGRLSDKDLDLARDLVSDIEGIGGIFVSESAIKDILQRRRADIERAQAEAASKLFNYDLTYRQYGLQPPSTAIFDYLSTSPSAGNADIAGEANLGD